MNQTAKWIIAGIIVVAVAGFGYSTLKGPGKQVSTEPIKIGFIGPLTGDAASLGTVARAAVQVSVGEVNAAGGINGKQIQMFYEDGQCNAQAAVSAAQKLINVDGVSAILGGTCSTETSAFVKMAMQSKVITFSYCSSAPSLTNSGPYFFRDYPSDTYQGKFGAQYAYQTLGVRKVAVLYHVSDWGTGIKTVFEQEFQALGGQVVGEEGLPQTAKDYRTPLSKIKSLNPDLIYSPMYPDGSIAALTQAEQLGIKTKFLGGDTWDDPNLQKKVSGKGTFLYTIFFTSALPQDLQQKILAISGGTSIPECAPTAYPAAKVLAAALAKGGTNPDSLAATLRATSYDGVSGHIAFDKNGDLTSAAYVVKKLQNGSAVEVK